jgi:hypothetical protein
MRACHKANAHPRCGAPQFQCFRGVASEEPCACDTRRSPRSLQHGRADYFAHRGSASLHLARKFECRAPTSSFVATGSADSSQARSARAKRSRKRVGKSASNRRAGRARTQRATRVRSGDHPAKRTRRNRKREASSRLLRTRCERASRARAATLRCECSSQAPRCRRSATYRALATAVPREAPCRSIP